MLVLYANCNLCGEILQYPYGKEKPELCKTCKPKPNRAKKRGNAYTRSKFESRVCRMLNKLLPVAEYIDSGYYSWMLSPAGYPLQLDRYYPELKTAFEIQGKQHKISVQSIHKTYESFMYLQECDKIKVKCCRERSVNLIHIDSEMSLSLKAIIKLLQEHGVWDRIRRTTLIGGVRFD